jgi:hypothetical protein
MPKALGFSSALLISIWIIFPSVISDPQASPVLLISIYLFSFRGSGPAQPSSVVIRPPSFWSIEPAKRCH